ncbi:hypothetical protein DM02DRAFT_441579 [Periconia macrospinosa]|uniref:Uncharacterized protein n=1 Tax=Periconia macrospinosa TaxID=97972 RepID=A0A2V1DLS9_9PLEO|nr:hypothetical protein DM02DRAFT_441579 [Periconia macrospinosa]
MIELRFLTATQGRPGYWITAYRTLTSQMIQDLKLDSQRWRAEKDGSQRGHGSGGSSLVREPKVSRQPDASLVAYQDSQTHASRQHYGPSEGYAASSRSSHPSTYGTTSESPHYTTTPTPSYPSHQTYGQHPPAHPAHTQPRTDPYANYGQTPPVRADYPGYTTAQPTYPYSQPAPDPYGRSTQPSQYATAPQPRYFGYLDQPFHVYR